MQLQLFRSLWGWQGDLGDCATQLREAGCSGVEARLPFDAPGRRALRDGLRAEALDYIATVFTGADVIPRQQDGPAVHLQHLARALDGAAETSLNSLKSSNSRSDRAFGRCGDRTGTFCAQSWCVRCFDALFTGSLGLLLSPWR